MDINHPGPVLVHLSKVPDDLDVHEYDGSGEWLKIWTLGLEWREDMGDPVHWLAYNNETVPARVCVIPPAPPPFISSCLPSFVMHYGLYIFS